MPKRSQKLLSLTLGRRRCPLPPPRPVLISPPHPPPWRKAPKAVDEDLYRISPELLHRRVAIAAAIMTRGTNKKRAGDAISST
ncbi:hypothetical protein LOK49_LG08G01330 [Camellia lanceoleosa]|uniref:Uncharacterized protein n=1 Tax=Camellia lanceoleosa TaxID=1840588 RepID=A0ACC0GXN4_9ERIC|nr:hypothetical protein LOK49_LG08G01330 [Camellia lanceoleosa]